VKTWSAGVSVAPTSERLLSLTSLAIPVVDSVDAVDDIDVDLEVERLVDLVVDFVEDAELDRVVDFVEDLDVERLVDFVVETELDRVVDLEDDWLVDFVVDFVEDLDVERLVDFVEDFEVDLVVDTEEERVVDALVVVVLIEIGLSTPDTDQAPTLMVASTESLPVSTNRTSTTMRSFLSGACVKSVTPQSTCPPKTAMVLPIRVQEKGSSQPSLSWLMRVPPSVTRWMRT